MCSRDTLKAPQHCCTYCCSQSPGLLVASVSVMGLTPDTEMYIGARILIENIEIYMPKYILRININTG